MAEPRIWEMTHAALPTRELIYMRFDPFGDVPPEEEAFRKNIAPDGTRRPLRGNLVSEVFHRKRAKLERVRKYFPETWHCDGEWIVSGKVRDIIEALEPGQHQFVPLQLRDKNDDPVDRETYVFFPVGFVQGLVPELSEVVPDPNWPGQFVKTRSNSRLVFRRAALEGRHVWFDPSLSRPHPFVSDAFRDSFRERKIRTAWDYEEHGTA